MCELNEIGLLRPMLGMVGMHEYAANVEICYNKKLTAKNQF